MGIENGENCLKEKETSTSLLLLLYMDELTRNVRNKNKSTYSVYSMDCAAAQSSGRQRARAHSTLMTTAAHTYMRPVLVTQFRSVPSPSGCQN